MPAPGTGGNDSFESDGGVEYGDIADSIDPKANGDAKCRSEDSPDSGPDGSGKVERHRLEGDSGGEVIFANDFPDNGLAGGGFNGLDESADESDGEDLDKGERSDRGGRGVENGRNHENDRSCD